MPILEPDLAALDFPPWRRVRQHFPSPPAVDVEAAVAATLASPATGGAIRPGMRVAVAVGSRGIACLQAVVRALVRELRARGASVFIVPAMGSHGGATAEGQAELLAGYGITEAGVGAPVRSSMEVVQLGSLPDGMPVWFDATAYREADAIIPVNRVKPHTDFRGPVESGLMKMIAIGLGKHKGCSLLHAAGMDRFPELIPATAQHILARAPIPFAVAIVENARHAPAIVEAVPAAQLLAREQELLRLARAYMPRILAPAFDLLVVQEIGKDVSGAGMDPNVTGRPTFPLPPLPEWPVYQRLAVLGLTEATHGNACGIGVADVTTRRCYEQIDLEATYTNQVAAGDLAGARLPLIAAHDREALTIAVRTVPRLVPERLRLLWIQSTAELEEVRVSEPLWQELRGRPDLEPLSEPEPMRFAPDGRLLL